MNCPRCHSPSNRVVNTVSKPDSVQRRRECEGCGHRFTSHETTEDVAGELTTLKKHLEPLVKLAKGEAV
jgi:transcriptional repressor NrdR